jgi:hypothetical protein
MTYRPFKMKGHELPGPNQRDPSPMKNRSAARDAASQSSAGQKIEGFNTGASDPRATGGHLDFYDRLHQTIFGDMTGGQYVAGAGPILQESPNQQEGPRDQVVSAATDASGNIIDETGVSETSKKKVDVEVTVNGQPV